MSHKVFARPGTLSKHKKENHEKLLNICPVCGKGMCYAAVLLFMIDNIREKQAVAEVVPSSCQSSARFSFFDGLRF